MLQVKALLSKVEDVDAIICCSHQCLLPVSLCHMLLPHTVLQVKALLSKVEDVGQYHLPHPSVSAATLLISAVTATPTALQVRRCC
jgi:hypothetical protein